MKWAPKLAELQAMLFTVQLVNERGVLGCVIEGDSKEVISLLILPDSLRHSFAHIIKDIIQLKRPT